jgi:PAS domain-containing protein
MEITKENLYEQIFQEMPCGAALHQLICDEEGKAVDYVTLEVNKEFIELLGVKSEDVVGVHASERLPSTELEYWLKIFGTVALEEKTDHYKIYSPFNKRHYNGKVICPKRGYFLAMFV